MIDRAIAAIDGKIAGLNAARAELLEQQRAQPARKTAAAPATKAGAGKGRADA